MADGSSLFRRLERDWESEGASRPARAALARWARSEPSLRELESPLEVVRRCHERVDAAVSRTLVEAVLAQAKDDPWAVRTVVQALLPGLAGVARRARGLRQGSVLVWESLEELDQHVVALAYERVSALAGRAQPWAAQTIIDGTWQRLRNYARSERRQGRSQAEFTQGQLRLEPSVSAAEELAEVLSDAVERGVVDPGPARVVYSFRVDGNPPDAVAPFVGHSARTLWRWLRRAEDALIADGCGAGGAGLAGAGCAGRGG